MSIRSVVALALVAAAVAAAPVDAQGRGRNTNDVPPGHRPPAGMCRIWIDGVPPGQQPAPTSCAEAVRNRPANGRVIFGSHEGARTDRRRADDRDCYVKEDTGKGKKRAKAECRDDDRRRGRDDDDDERDPSSQSDQPRGRLPEMIGAIVFERGRRTADVSRWLGPNPLTARYVDANRNGVPERATWRNSRGEVVQVWIDSDGDGRADRVNYYEDGRLVRSVKP